MLGFRVKWEQSDHFARVIIKGKYIFLKICFNRYLKLLMIFTKFAIGKWFDGKRDRLYKIELSLIYCTYKEQGAVRTFVFPITHTLKGNLKSISAQYLRKILPQGYFFLYLHPIYPPLMCQVDF